jgi:hypothetical protein
MSGLPKWAGADAVYSRAYRVLEKMARAGHVCRTPKRRGQSARCTPSEDMNDLITALASGNEERIKGLLMQLRDRGFTP